MPFAMPPGLRIPYDSDGSIGMIHPDPSVGGGIQEIPAAAMEAMNSTMGAGMWIPSTVWPDSASNLRPVAAEGQDVDGYPNFVVLFPVPTRLRGIFLSFSRSYSLGNYGGDPVLAATKASDYSRVEVSRNSTNGIDGTWTLLDNFIRGLVPVVSNVTGRLVTTGADTNVSVPRAPKDVYRLLKSDDGVGIDIISGVNARNVTAIRVFPYRTDSYGAPANASPAAVHMHLYGEPDTEAFGGNYLQGWRADQDMRLGGATMSWGDVASGSTSDKTFRIKNMSAEDTANNVVITTVDEAFYPSPSVAAQMLYSLDNITFTSSITIAAIGPGTVSSVIYMRRVTPTNSPLTTWSPKVKFTVGSWS